MLLGALPALHAASSGSGSAKNLASSGPVDEVNNTIGGVGILLEPTRPTVQVPNGMVRFYPMRKDQVDDQISSFPLSTISHRLGELFWMMPVTGTPDEASWKTPAAYDQETTTPFYFSTRFDDSLIRTEFTPSARSAIFRFHFPGTGVILLGNRLQGTLAQDGTNGFSGYEEFNGMKAYVYGIFDKPVAITPSTSSQTIPAITNPVTSVVTPSASITLGRLTVKPSAAGELQLRYGISYLSVEQARRNLEKEIPAFAFDKVRENARTQWNKVLGRLVVEGGTPAQRHVFYTALARCYERMVNITEDGRYYSAFDHKAHEDKRPFYTDNWLWDTFRAKEPLHALLDPKMQADKLQSYVRMYEQSGLMPTFAVLYGHHACMNGNHAAAWFADSWAKGIRDFDLAKAYEGLKKRSLEVTKLPWRNQPNCALDTFYHEKGYFPALHPGEVETEPLVDRHEKRQPVAVTLENSFDDWCIAQLAGYMKQPEDREMFLRKAANYKNVFRVEKGIMWPKDAEGKWIEPFDPKTSGGQGGRDQFDENNGFTYNWDANQDYQGLFALMGGRKAAEAKLDQLFREEMGRPKYEFFEQWPDSTAMVGQFTMGNEPSFAIPFIYDRLGVPWKTQKRVRMLLDTFFTDTLTGIPGDEDGGGMSAFVVFAMMGIYPVTPGIPVYDVCAPVFTRSVIHLEGGKTFTIEAPNASSHNKYIQSLSLNGKPLDHLWITHADIIAGGTLSINLSDTPNTKLGQDPSTFPPSSLDADPLAYAKAPKKG